MAILRIHAPVIGQEERVLPWDGRSLLLGRGDDCDVVLLESSASRHHARLERRGDEIALVDCGSANGTWVGDERVWGERVLHDGDVMRIGDTTLELVLDPHHRPTLIRDVVPRDEGHGPDSTVAQAEADAPASREDIGSGPTVAAPAPIPAPVPIPAPIAAPAPAPAPSSASVYSLGNEPTLARDDGPRSLGLPDRSAPSVYSLGNEPASPSREPEVFVPGPSAPSVYSLGGEPAPPSREPDRFDLPASAPSVYSLGDAPAPVPRGPGLSGPASSAELGAPPPPPAAIPGPIPAPAAAPHHHAHPAASPRPGAASSWEWSEPPPSHHHRHRAAGPALWLGVGLLVGGIIAIIIALAAGFRLEELGSLLSLVFPVGAMVSPVGAMVSPVGGTGVGGPR